MKSLFRKLISVAGLGLALLGSAEAQTKINLAGPQVTGTLPAARGGTGDSSITGITKGNGTSPFTAAVGSDVISLWTGTCSSSTFLRGDGSCQAPAGAGTVIGATFSGGIISVTGTTTLAFTVAGTSGGIPFFNSATGWASSGVLGSGQFVLGGGVGTTPTTSFSVVPVTNGGSGAASLTGLLKGNGTSAFTAAASSDVIALWTGSCSATTFLRGDGSCQTVSGSGNTTSATGTVNFVTKYTAANTIGNSLASDSGTVFLYTGSGGITANSGGSASILTLGDSGINCPTTITSGTSGICSASFVPLWITNNSGTPATTTIETQNNKGASNGYASLDGTANVPATQLLNFPGAVFALTGNTSLAINATATTWTTADYGASPTQPIVYTDNATSSTDISPDLYVNTGGSSFHRPVEFALRGVDQFQICEQSGPQGQAVFGSVVTCANINNSPFAKIIMESQTAAHTIVRFWQASTSASGDEIEVNNATAQGTGWYFARGYSGVTSTDTSNGGGVESFHIRGDGQFQANTTSSVSQYAVWKNTTAALVGTSQASPNLALCGTEWHSSASVEGCLNLEFVPGTGLDAANTITFTHTGSATGVTTLQSPGPVASASDGTHAAYLSLLGNTTAPAITANTFGILGPNSASFTAYAIQLPATNPATATPILSCITPVSSISACTWVAAGAGTVTSVAETVNSGSSSGLFTITGSPITSSGTLNIGISGTSGALAYMSSTTVMSSKSWADLDSAQYAAAGGSANAQTVTLAPAATSLVAGLEVNFLPVANNSTTTPTMALNGLAAKVITKQGTTALAANDLTTTAVASVIYDGTQWQLQNPQTLTGGAGTVTVVGAGSLTSTALVTGGGSQTLQTPSATSTLSSGGNMVLAGTATATSFIASGTTAGFFQCTQGTANGHATVNTITVECPAAVTAFEIVLPGTASTGIPHYTNASNVITESISLIAIADLSATGSPSSSTYLRGDNTWATISGGGTPCTTTASSLQYDNAGSFGCTPDFTFNGTHSIVSGASGILDLHSAATAGFLLPGSLSTGVVSVTTTTGAISSIATSGSGNVCLSTSCSMTTPVLGTPTSGTLTNATGLPMSAVVSATGAIATIANGNNPLTLNCATTTASHACVTFGETTAASAASDVELQLTTVATSKAIVEQITQGTGVATTANAVPAFFSATGGAGGAVAATANGNVGGFFSVTTGAGSAGGATSGTGGAGGDVLFVTATGGAATSGSTTGRGGNFSATLGAAGGTGTLGAPGQFLIIGNTVGGANTTPFLNITGTWNTSGVVDAAIFANITNTGSGALSKLIDLQIGSTSQFNVDKSGNETLLGSLAVGTSPPACTVGTGGFICLTAGTAFTNVAGTSGIYADSTINEFVGKTAGASGGGVMVRTQPGSIRSTGLVGAVSTATLCAASAGACNTAGTYHVHIALYQSGVACTTNTTGGVTPTLTWTDGNGTAHTAVGVPLETNSSLIALTGTMLFNQTAAGIGTVFGSGDINLDTNGSIIQYAIGFAQCSVSGTATYAASLTVDRLQ